MHYVSVSSLCFSMDGLIKEAPAEAARGFLFLQEADCIFFFLQSHIKGLNTQELSLLQSSALQGEERERKKKRFCLCKDSRFSLSSFRRSILPRTDRARVTLRKRKSSHSCGQDAGSYGPLTRVCFENFPISCSLCGHSEWDNIPLSAPSESDSAAQPRAGNCFTLQDS